MMIEKLAPGKMWSWVKLIRIGKICDIMSWASASGSKQSCKFIVSWQETSLNHLKHKKITLADILQDCASVVLSLPDLLNAFYQMEHNSAVTLLLKLVLQTIVMSSWKITHIVKNIINKVNL